MPTLGNITIKKADGTTDVTYVAVSGAAGDGTPAIFRNPTVGATRAEFPSLLVKASDNGPRTARRVRVDFSWPIPATDAGGNTVIAGRMSGECSVLIPQNQTPAVIQEQAFQFGNLLGSVLMKQCFAEGAAPRG